MRKELEQFDLNREKVIKQSREIIKLSKLIIYSVQRGSIHEASNNLAKIKQQIKKLPEDNFNTGMASVARQEFVEALTFYHFMKDGKLITKAETGIPTYEYLLGLCDLSGELVRKAVNLVIKCKFDEADKIRNFVNEMYHEFLNFNLGNGELRKKSDQIKWNLEKLEGIIYDLKIKRG